MADISSLVDRLRRAIGDTDEEDKDFSDNVLIEYLEDAVYNILLKWEHSYTVENETIVPEPSELEKTMFVMQAKLDLLNRQPRLSFRSGALSVTHRGDDRERLEGQLKKAIRKAKSAESMGTSLTEFDDFARRLQDRIYINTIP